jgi:uncharacterized membrane protein YbhN (UPF0104 family)
MSDVAFYFKTGWHHIISWDALDHILFIMAFTLGHSLTLALSVYDVVRFSEKWVEFLIPCTIIATAIFNFFVKEYNPKSLRINYFLALFFGLIHGMGFANTIRFILAKNQGIAVPLVSFNIGLEAGQIVVVTFILFASYLLVNKLNLNRKWWVWSLSAIAILFGLVMVKERWPL